MKQFLTLIITLVLSVSLFTGCAGLSKVPVPPECADALVYKYAIYPDVTAAVEGGFAILVTAKPEVAPTAKSVLLIAKEAFFLGNYEAAVMSLFDLCKINEDYAPTALFAVTQLRTRLKGTIYLSKCDKDVFMGMCDQAIAFCDIAIKRMEEKKAAQTAPPK